MKSKTSKYTYGHVLGLLDSDMLNSLPLVFLEHFIESNEDGIPTFKHKTDILGFTQKLRPHFGFTQWLMENDIILERITRMRSAGGKPIFMMRVIDKRFMVDDEITVKHYDYKWDPEAKPMNFPQPIHAFRAAINMCFIMLKDRENLLTEEE